MVRSFNARARVCVCAYTYMCAKELSSSAGNQPQVDIYN